MFAPENLNGWPFSISWSPDLVTKLGCAASGDAPECCGTVSATVVPPATTTAAAATASATRLDHPLGSNHFTCFMCRTHHFVVLVSRRWPAGSRTPRTCARREPPCYGVGYVA